VLGAGVSSLSVHGPAKESAEAIRKIVPAANPIGVNVTEASQTFSEDCVHVIGADGSSISTVTKSGWIVKGAPEPQ
jgi:hypothetical protein